MAPCIGVRIGLRTGCVPAYLARPSRPSTIPGRIRTSLATPRPPGGDQSGGEAPLSIGYCLRRCHGAPPKSGSTAATPAVCPSGQREQTVNLPAQPSQVRILAPPHLRRPPPNCGNAARRGSFRLGSGPALISVRPPGVPRGRGDLRPIPAGRPRSGGSLGPEPAREPSLRPVAARLRSVQLRAPPPWGRHRRSQNETPAHRRSYGRRSHLGREQGSLLYAHPYRALRNTRVARRPAVVFTSAVVMVARASAGGGPICLRRTPGCARTR